MVDGDTNSLVKKSMLHKKNGASEEEMKTSDHISLNLSSKELGTGNVNVGALKMYWNTVYLQFVKVVYATIELNFR